MKYYLKALKNYSNFSGRSRRKEYFFFCLFNFIFAVFAIILDNLFGLTFDLVPYGSIYALYTLCFLIPNLAVTVRRLHDIGKSGWMILISIIPIIGLIWFLVLLFTDSDPGENEYGQNPKEELSI